MFGISGTELIILAIITFVVIGPERMPEYARQIREFVKTVRRMAFDAKDDFKEALGETGLEDINWRQYDPTSFYMIVGLIAADAGSVMLDGQELRHLPIHERARLGVGYLPQEASIFRKRPWNKISAPFWKSA